VGAPCRNGRRARKLPPIRPAGSSASPRRVAPVLPRRSAAAGRRSRRPARRWRDAARVPGTAVRGCADDDEKERRMFETFQARAQAVGAEVHRFGDRARALEFVLDLLRKEGVSREPGAGAVWADGPFLAGADRDALARAAPGLAFEVTRSSAAAAKVGITDAGFMVANTGTLATAADGAAGRLAAMLPTIHVAVVDSARIVPDLGALFRHLSPAQTRYLALVTGPSRTADIERVLTIGVHGPARLVVVAVDGLQGRNQG
jgi:L-lactate dehydrogenase complex protein LldG